MSASKAAKKTMRYGTMLKSSVPVGRNGKHKTIVTEIMGDLNLVEDDSVVQVPLDELDETVANIRSAMNRAAKKDGRKIATSSDERFLYLWNVKD